MLEVKHLKALKLIRDTSSLAESAKALNLSASALSHQMKDLEEHYGCTLFVRKSKPIVFTPAGKALLNMAEQALPLFNDAENRLLGYAGKRYASFFMALECHSCYNWLIQSINEFRKLWPDSEIDLSAEFNFNPLPKLMSKELDMVITGDPNPKVPAQYIPLFNHEMMLAVSNRKPDLGRPYMMPEDIADETLITYPVEPERLTIINSFLSPAGIIPKRMRTAELTIMIVEQVASGRGVCCLPNWALEEFIQNAPIKTYRMTPKGIHETLYAACRPEEANERMVTDFVEVAKSICTTKLKGITLC